MYAAGATAAESEIESVYMDKRNTPAAIPRGGPPPPPKHRGNPNDDPLCAHQGEILKSVIFEGAPCAQVIRLASFL